MQKKRKHRPVSMLLVVIMISTIFVGITPSITPSTSMEAASISSDDLSLTSDACRNDYGLEDAAMSAVLSKDMPNYTTYDDSDLYAAVTGASSNDAAFKAEELTLTPGSTQYDMNFTWYSDRDAGSQSTVQITKTTYTVCSESPMTQVIEITGTSGNASAGKSWHKASVSGLIADTEYTYRISNDGVLF
ncbi:MAG: fibronectin type III domain-containing protein, partial [Candidatus Methanoplasma sp.]|nr:fibronectin type III domain-containing protein [Candidatus Methanoplasma sp.]